MGMSVARFTSSWFSLGPKVWMSGGRLFARASLALRALSFFSHDRKVVVDPAASVVRIFTRYAWIVFRGRRIPFSKIECVDYRYGGVGRSWGLTPGGLRGTDAIDIFTVQLVLRDSGVHVDLFSFVGEGAAMTGVSGVLLGTDTLVDLQGDQEDASRNYVELLSRLIGVPIGRPVAWRSKAVQQGLMTNCLRCGQTIPIDREHCLYCGAEVFVTPRD
jgi:hypothetical protein